MLAAAIAISMAATITRTTTSTASVQGPEEVVFDASAERCEPDDIPDGPARAYRDAEGRTHLVAPHWTNRRATGASLNDVKHRCAITMRSRLDPDPSVHQHYEWLRSPYTLDGQTVYSLVHNEFQGNRSPTHCPSRTYEKCWYNTITLAISTDQGATFSHRSGPAHLVASPPYAYVPDGGPQGSLEPTNIVESPTDGLYYAMFQVRGFRSQASGVCVMRTSRLGDPASWRAWDGRDWNAATSSGDTCEPVESMLHDGLTWNTHYGKYVLVGINQTAPAAYEIAFKTSTDLIHWSAPTKLHDTKGWGSSGTLRMYPALLDPSSKARNYDTTGRHPYLYFTRFNGDTWSTMDRDLVRVPIRLP